MKPEDRLSQVVIGAAIEVHRELGGPGLLERVYLLALEHELELRGLRVEREAPVPVVYKGVELSPALKLDLLVEGRLILECKATAEFHSIYTAQALTYLRLSNLPLALILNFGQRLLRDGIRRVVNQL